MEAMLRELLFPHVRALVRYRWQALAVAWLVAMIGWPVVMVMPDKFEASTRVYVDTDSILLPLLEGLTVQPDVEQRLLIMTKTLLSRPNLEKVVDEVDFGVEFSTAGAKEELVERLAQEIRLISPSARSGQNNLYTLHYTHNDPVTAKQVIQVLLNILVETALGSSRQDSDSAQLFLAQQIKQYDARLVLAEDRLMAFKRKNFNILPSQEGGFFQDLRKAEQDLEAANLEMREAEFSRKELENRLLEFVASFEGGEIKVDGRYDERLRTMQAQLDEKKLRFTDLHPDIIELERVINELEQLKLQELRGNNDSSSQASKPEDSRLHQELTLALAQANARIASLRVRMNEYQKRATVLKDRISTLPEVEAELASLSRDYDITKMKYEQLVERLESARLSESAEESGDNVKFRVVDPPWVPATPSGPNRLILLTMVLAAAIGVGVGLAILIGFLRPVVSDMYGLAKITDLSIYGAVTRIDSGMAGIAAIVKTHLLFLILLVMLLASYGAFLWLSMMEYSLPDLFVMVKELL